jgi:hypothetical protein
MYTGLLASTTVGAQAIQDKFVQYRAQAAQEKVYVHTDREAYVTGETLQASLFVVDGSFHKPSDLSKVAYLELVDATSKAIVQTKVALKTGRGGASVFLPASLSSGNYELRAYTRWMKNYSSEFFFHKKISVVNPFVRMDAVVAVKTTVDARFFPEGGNWIAGAEGRMGFKVNDSYGRAIDFRGSLIDESNDTLLRFHAHKFGMGSFTFAPTAGKSYRAVIATNGVRQIFNLPSVSTTGFSLSLVQSGTTLQVKVHGPSSAPVFLFAHARQAIVKAVQKMIVDERAVFEFPLGDIPEGITHFTIFDAGQNPVGERLFFKRPTEALALNVATSSQSYGSRREVSLTLSASEVANASISVFRLDSLSGEPAGRILEYLWLSSDLNGFIESPAYYFNEGEEARIAADNLMLTQGWRKFKWADVLSGTKAMTLMPENHGHLIEGIVKNANGDPAPNVRTYLASPDQIVNVYSSWSNPQGMVIYDVRNLYGKRKLVTSADSTFRVQLLSPYSTEPVSTPLMPLSLPPSTASGLLERSVAMQVQDVYYDATIRPVSFDSLSFYGKADATYLLDDYTRFPVLEEVLREYVPGVHVRKNKKGFHFVVLNDVTNTVFTDPTVLLDGVPIYDLDKLMAFDPLKIRKLEVMKRTVYASVAIFQGLVSFTTYDGDLGGYELGSQYATIDFDGLNLQREFYTPSYKEEAYENLPDPRTLLYWNPSIAIDQATRTLKFYTSDMNGNYAVVVEALGEGKAGSGIQRFTVAK